MAARSTYDCPRCGLADAALLYAGVLLCAGCRAAMTRTELAVWIGVTR